MSDNRTIDQTQTSATVHELGVINILSGDNPHGQAEQEILGFFARAAFRDLQKIPRPDDAIDRGVFLLRVASLAIIGDVCDEIPQSLRGRYWLNLSLSSDDWGDKVWATVLDVWLRLVYGSDWVDRLTVSSHVASLRKSQLINERLYLIDQERAHVKTRALELIGLYHLAKAAETFAQYIGDEKLIGNIPQLVESHFDCCLAVCKHAQLAKLENLTILLAACVKILLEKIEEELESYV